MMRPYPAIDRPEEFRVLGIDTALRNTGLAVVAGHGGGMRALWHGTVHVPAKRPLSECLARLHEEVTGCLAAMHPAAVALEGIFYFKYARTALALGQARGVVIAACATAGVPIYEYEPRRVKQSVTGFGAASKAQMQGMMKNLLNLPETPREDEGDALALAVCHLHLLSGVAALQREPI